MSSSYDFFSGSGKASAPFGRCEYCNEEVFDINYALSEEDVPYRIDQLYFHERCIMPYAEVNWKIDWAFEDGDDYEFMDD